jgi:beta-lactamase regulating signal transducer with metallopeptidase domain
MLDPLLSWLPTYFLHSTVLLGLLALVEQRGGLARLAPRSQEWLWRAALLAPVLSASLMLWPSESVAPAPVSEPVASVAAAGLPEPVAVAPDPTPHSVVAAPAPEAAPAWRGASTLVGLSGLWAVGALGALGLLGVQFLALRRRLVRLPRIEDARWQRLNAEAAAQAGVRAPRLRLASAWASPLLAPGRTLCLPDWTLALDDLAARAVLAHEMAHLRRRDLAWRLAGECVARLFWMQPLNRWALRRLDLLAELACDAAATPAPAARTALAESLLRCAEALSAPSPALACAVGGPGSALALRVRQLLAGPSAPPPGSGRVRLGLLLAVLTLAVMALPVVVVSQADAHALVSRLAHSPLGQWIGHGDGVLMVFGDDGKHRRIRLDGQARFNADETELVSLTGRLEFSERDGEHLRRLVVTGHDGSALQRVYSEDGVDKPMDEAAQAWATGLMRQIAEVCTDPGQRAKRLFEQGGLERVLVDLEREPADNHLRLRRAEGLFGLGQKLDDAALARVFKLAGRIEGDFERRELLTLMAHGQALGAAQQIVYLQTAAGLGGAFELRETLAALAPQLLHSPEVLTAWREALRRIDGDFELREALSNQLNAGADPALLGVVLDATRQLGGAFERREALSAVARQLQGDQPALTTAYLQSAAEIDGDFERREALMALLDRPLPRAGMEQLISAAGRIGGSFERLEVLKRVAERATAPDAALAAQLRQAGRGLGEFERGQLEVALDRLGG